jgi:hypothetical protein
MSEKAQEVLLGMLVEPPEFDADEDDLEERYSEAFYESSKINIHEVLKTKDFKNTWLVLKIDIQNKSLEKQRIFVEQTIDKILEVYDYSFSINISVNTQEEINLFYEFLEFLEYDNEQFLISVWSFLTKENILNIDISDFSQKNKNLVIKEIEEQLEIHPQNELITLFLRSCPEDILLDWFIAHTKRNKINIVVNVFRQ